jgi:hypothetical protein
MGLLFVLPVLDNPRKRFPIAQHLTFIADKAAAGAKLVELLPGNFPVIIM